MKNAQPDRARLFRFYQWLSRPTGMIYGLEIVLKQLRDVELLHIMQDKNPQAKTLAWAEYGRRHTTANIKMSMHSQEVVEVEVCNLNFGATLGIA